MFVGLFGIGGAFTWAGAQLDLALGYRNWVRSPRGSLLMGVVVSTTLFTFMHPPTNIWLTLNQIGLGVGAALITWRTGGLEIAILLHAGNRKRRIPPRNTSTCVESTASAALVSVSR